MKLHKGAVRADFCQTPVLAPHERQRGTMRRESNMIGRVRIRRVGRIIVMLFVVVGYPLSLSVRSANAQSVGVRGGVSVDPDQFYFGGHVESAPLIDRLHFRPNLEVGVGDDRTLVAFNFEFAYHFPSQTTWNVYAGAGPALNLLRFRGDTNPGGGLNLLMGVQHNRGLFAEFKVGTVDSPRVKFAVGYAARWQ
jgi:hypothetical protein